MRQAGMKPKSHSSGTYWIRANAGNEVKEDKGFTGGFVLLFTIFSALGITLLGFIDKYFY